MAISGVDYGLQETVRRARDTPDKTAAQRRHALEKLIELSSASDSRTKDFAAQNIAEFSADFPDLEEAAINAVYDVCEDQSADVRKSGYRAITSLSRKNRKWVRRNADVLLQLLQSEEPDEVQVVSEALVDHLNLDAQVTTSILCEQISPLDDGADAEEKQTRDKSRAMVVHLLSKRVDSFTPQVAQFLADGLLSLIPKLQGDEVRAVVKSILLPLASKYSTLNIGKSVISLLHHHISTSLQLDLDLNPPALRGATKTYLSLLIDLRSISVPTDIHRSMLSNFPARTLSTLPPADRALILGHVVSAQQACDEDSSTGNNFIRHQTLNMTLSLVEPCQQGLRQMPPSVQTEMLSKIQTLLQSCLNHKQKGWMASANIVASLRTLDRTLASIHLKTSKDCQQLVKELTTQPQTPERPQHLQSSSSKRLLDDTLTDPPKPSKKTKSGRSSPSVVSRVATPVQSSSSQPVTPDAEMSGPSFKSGLQSQRGRGRGVIFGGGDGRGLSDPMGRRFAASGRGGVGSAPGQGDSGPANRRNVKTNSNLDSSPSSQGGLSIKGAATRAASAASHGKGREPSAQGKKSGGPQSLLDRISGPGTNGTKGDRGA